MAIKFEIKSADVSIRSGTSQKTGKAYSIHEQEAWGFFVDAKGQPHPYPQKTRLTLEDGQPPYAPGVYVLADNSFYVDRFGQVVCRAKLQPVAAATRQAA